MSFFQKHHLLLPYFKLSETITGQTKDNSQTTIIRKNKPPIRRMQTERRQPEKITDIHIQEQCQTQIESPRVIKYKQNTAITPKPSKSEDHSLNQYLEHLNSLRRDKTIKKPIIRQIKSEHEMMLFDTSIQYSKFRKVQESQKLRKKVSLLDAIRNPNSQQYIRFSQQIYTLIHSLHSLKEYINNSRKLFQVVKNLIGNKKNLIRVLLRPNGDDLVDFQDISKQCCIKDIIYMNGEQRIVTKFDLSLHDDLVHISEAIQALLLQTQLSAIKQMSNNIKNEENEINKLEQSLGFKLQESKLALKKSQYQRYNPHLEIENMEQRLGPMSYIPRELRQTSQAIGEIITKLNVKQ